MVSTSPAVLTLADFPVASGPDLPEGLRTHRGVRLLPGAAGLYDVSGQRILSTWLRRGSPGGLVVIDRLPPVGPSARRGRAAPIEAMVFLPSVGLPHFGHLLTEGAAHLWPLLDPAPGLDGIAGKPALLVVATAYPDVCAQLSRLLGLPRQRVVSTLELGRAQWVQTAHVPMPSMVNRWAIAPRHFANVRTVVDRCHGLTPGDIRVGGRGRSCPKVYLSRAALPAPARRVAQEDELEAHLRGMGWTIVHPEQLDMRSQLDALGSARVIAGCLGSAFHLLMYFGTEVSGRRVIGLGGDAHQTNENFPLQFSGQGLDYRHVVCLAPDPDCVKTDRHLIDLVLTVPPVDLASLLESLAS